MEIRSEIEDNRIWHLSAVEGEKILGFIDAEIEEGELFITGIYVDEAVRRMGIAGTLLDALCDVFADSEVPMGITIIYALDEELKSLDAFMESRGDFVFEEDCIEYVITPDEWKNSRLVAEIKKSNATAGRLAEISKKDETSLVEFFSRSDIEVLPDEGDMKDYYDGDLSVYLVENGEIGAALMARVSDNREKTVEISAIACEKDIQTKMVGLLSSFARTYESKYPDYDVTFLALNSGLKDFADRLFTNVAGKTSVRTANWIGL